ncbi:MAG: ACP S-malonyltransferase [Agarilytica sp.]
MSAYVFPGQGAQSKGMGAHLFDEIDEFATNETEINSILGCSLRELCVENPDNKLKLTQFTQPCLYVVNALHYFDIKNKGGAPNLVAGHSLGEYNALLAAGAFDFLTGLRMVVKRGQLMSEAKNGGMAAVIGMTDREVRSVLQAANVVDIDVANFNEPRQIVLSGPVGSIRSCAKVFDSAGAKNYVPLPVSAAFHSRYMADAARAYQQFLVDFSFASLNIPVVSNVTGRPYPAGDPTLTIRAFLVRQICQSVKWTQSVRYMLDHDVSDIKEVGHGQVLTGLVGKIKSAYVESLDAA